jgi:gliding motility-associated-like protein
MKHFNFMLSICIAFNSYAQCELEVLDFNWETTTATIAVLNDINCNGENGVDEITLYLGSTSLDTLPPCGNFSQNINWPEYTFTFFDDLNATAGDTIELNIFDAWNNGIANPYTIAECWVQLYEEGFFCNGGTVGIWQVNISDAQFDMYVTFDGPCPCDPVIEYVDVIEYVYLTDTIEVVVYDYIYITDTIVIYDCDEYQDPGIGLEGTDEITGIEPGDCHTAYVPNVFTPNGDGLNDRWRVITRDCWHSFDLKVFNRWGQLIWYSSDPLEWWYGDVQDGVYTWKAVMIDGNIVIDKTGHVTIIQ